MTREWMQKQVDIYQATEELRKTEYLTEKETSDIRSRQLYDVVGMFAAELAWGKDQNEPQESEG
jgi:hypothetical protein